MTGAIVAPLEWKEFSSATTSADVGFGLYVVSKCGDKWMMDYHFQEYVDEGRIDCESEEHGKELAWEDWVKRCEGLFIPAPAPAAPIDPPHPDGRWPILNEDQLVRLVELTASYVHGSAEYWNPKDAFVLVKMAEKMEPCATSADANLYRLRDTWDCADG